MTSTYYKVMNEELVIGIVHESSSNGIHYKPFISEDFLILHTLEDHMGWDLEKVLEKLRTSFGELKQITTEDLGEWTLYLSPSLRNGKRMISLENDREFTPIKAKDIMPGDILYHGAQSFFRSWKGENAMQRIHPNKSMYEVLETSPSNNSREEEESK